MFRKLKYVNILCEIIWKYFKENFDNTSEII